MQLRLETSSIPDLAGAHAQISRSPSGYSVSSRVWTTGERTLAIESYKIARTSAYKNSYKVTIVDPRKSWHTASFSGTFDHFGTFPRDFQVRLPTSIYLGILTVSSVQS